MRLFPWLCVIGGLLDGLVVSPAGLVNEVHGRPDPRTWTLWRVDYWQGLREGDSSVTPLETKVLEASLTRLECQVIKLGKVADERAASHKQPFPDSASMLDAGNSRHLVTRFTCSREKPRVP